MHNIFDFKEKNKEISPQLIINKSQLITNIDHVVKIANNPKRLWPHVKTHKTGRIIELLNQKGITNFKCATIAEAEMVSNYNAENILLAYPLVGPNADRLISLAKAYPKTTFHALFDDKTQLCIFAEKCEKANLTMAYMIDVNVGQNRTGIKVEDVTTFLEYSKQFKSIKFSGLHCYDGHRHENNIDDRMKETCKTSISIIDLCQKIEHLQYVIMGGSPSFPCYAKYSEFCLSPGTIFLNDYGYSTSFKDLDFHPAAAIFTRVVSNPLPGIFTLDLGYKGIASDPKGTRGKITGLNHYKELIQNEEHWVFEMDSDHIEDCPKVGDELFVIPTHICPTFALYPFSTIVDNEHKIDTWEVTARNRKINF